MPDTEPLPLSRIRAGQDRETPFVAMPRSGIGRQGSRAIPALGFRVVFLHLSRKMIQQRPQGDLLMKNRDGAALVSYGAPVQFVPQITVGFGRESKFPSVFSGRSMDRSSLKLHDLLLGRDEQRV